MGVDSIFEMYSFLWSWHQYNAVWDVLRATGFAYIPFFGLLLNAFLDTNLSQDPASSSFTSLKIIEIELAMMFVVIILAVQPSVKIHMKDMEYIAICSDQITESNPHPDEEKKRQESKEKQYSLISEEEAKTQYQYLQLSKDFETLRIPVWLYAVYSFSSGFVQTAKKMTGCIDDITLARYSIDTSVIQDRELIKELLWFQEECHFKALAKYRTELLHKPDWRIPAYIDFLKGFNLHDQPGDTTATSVDFGGGMAIKDFKGPWLHRWEMEAWFGKADIQWMGSMILSFLYYQYIKPASFHDPKAESQQTCYDHWYGTGKTDEGSTITSWLNYNLSWMPGIEPDIIHTFGLRDKILYDYAKRKNLPFTQNGDVPAQWYEDIRDEVYERVKRYEPWYVLNFSLTPFISTNTFEAKYGKKVINPVVQNEFVKTLVSNTTPYVSSIEIEEGSFRKSYTQLANRIGLFLQGLSTSAELKVMRDLMPMFSAFTLLGITLLLPVGFVLSSYSIEFVVIASIAIFTVKLWHFLWHIAWWLEQNLWMAMGITPLSIEEYLSKEDLVWFVSVSMYLVLPAIFTAVLGWAGIQLGGLAQAAVGTLSGSIRQSVGAATSWAITSPLRTIARINNEIRSVRQTQDKLKERAHNMAKVITVMTIQNQALREKIQRQASRTQTNQQQGTPGQQNSGGSQQGGGSSGQNNNTSGNTP